MIYISGLVYVLAILILGSSLRFSFMLITKNRNITTVNLDFFTHSFFQGVLCILIILNFIQFVELSNQTIKAILLGILTVASIVIIKGIFSLPFKYKKLNHSQFIFLLVALISSLVIYLNGAHLPNIAWDSWTVWEGRANQWIEHGLYIDIESTQAWLKNNAIYNQSSNYPEGLSLIYYVPKLFIEQSFQVTHFLYLFAYGLTVLMLQNHIRKMGASFFLQTFLVLIAFTLPLMSNHLIISGYADIWVAMILVLVILSYIEYYTLQSRASLITLLGYVLLLPMFKLEGWIWLILLVLAHLMTVVKSNRRVKLITLGLLTTLFLAIAFGVNISTPIGQLVLTSERINIFSLIDSPIEFRNISGLLLSGLFWQNNWSLIWLGLPFLMFSFLTAKQNKTSNTINLFFSMSILSFLFLFYFTQASQWAEDFTAINRIVLQLTPCYLLLLFRMLAQFETTNKAKHQQHISQ